jgi:hypothetical protein
MTFHSILEIKNQAPGVWYARVLFNNPDGTQQSLFFKMRMIGEPTQGEVMEVVNAYLA